MLTKRGHIAEVLRQGVWASLTGGWYYEPASSIFTNTVHLYIWLLLFVLPLLLGIGGDASNIFHLCAYLGTVTLLFGGIKTLTLYLHSVLDANEPIVMSARARESPAARCQSPLSSLSIRATESNAIEMVDLSEVTRRLRPAADGLDEAESSAAGKRRQVRISQVQPSSSESSDGYYEEEKRRASCASQAASLRCRGRDSDSVSSNSGKNSSNGLLSLEQGLREHVKSSGSKSPPFGIAVLPADSLELLPSTSTVNNRRPSDTHNGHLQYRKLSGPEEAIKLRKFNVIRRKSEEKAFLSSRHSSQSSGRDRRARLQTVTSAAPHPTRSSSSSSKRGRRRHHVVRPPGGVYVDELAMRKADSIDNWLATCASHVTRQHMQQQELLQQSIVPAFAEQQDTQAEDPSQPGCSTSVAPSQGTRAVARGSEESAQTSPTAPMLEGDVKLQIIQFLERLIERHPETLDAIESIRVSRLRGSAIDRDFHPSYALGADSAGRGEPSTSLHQCADNSQELLQLLDSMQLNNLDDDASRHIARDHNDCSQGATHCYQDEHGTWWTYSFDESGSGTARPLGTNTMISDLLNQRAEQYSGQQCQQGAAPSAMDREQLQASEKPSEDFASADGSHRSSSREASAAHGATGKISTEEEISSYQPEIRTNIRLRDVESASSDEEADRYISDRPMGILGPMGRQMPNAALLTSPQGTSAAPKSTTSTIEHGIERPTRTGSTHCRQHSDAGAPHRQSRHSSSFNLVNLASALVPRFHHNQGSSSSRFYVGNQAAGDLSMHRPMSSLLSVMASSNTGAAVTTLVNQPHNLATTGRLASLGQRMAANEQHRRLFRLHNTSQRIPAVALTSSAIEPPNEAAHSLLGVDEVPVDVPASPTTARNLNSISALNAMRLFAELHGSSSDRRNELLARTILQPAVSKPKVDYYYKVKFLPAWLNSSGGVMLKLDRIMMASLFDRNLHIGTMLFDIGLSFLVATLGAALLLKGLYTDLSMVIFCFVIAGSQFSLLKSVQPDPTSPTHGFNATVAYSRPLYFCIVALLILSLDSGFMDIGVEDCTYAGQGADICLSLKPSWLRLYIDHGYKFSIKSFLCSTILLLPLIFTLGLVPQINTLVMHLLEQVDIHLFGASAALSLLSALLSLLRSILVCVLLTILGASVVSLDSQPRMGDLSLAIFSVALICSAYLLSRWPSGTLFLRLILSPIWLLCRKRRRNDPAEAPRYPTAECIGNPWSLWCHFSRLFPCGGTYPTKKANILKRDDEKRCRLRSTAEASKHPESVLRRNSSDTDTSFLRRTMSQRLQHDLIHATLSGLVIFAVCTSSLIQLLHPYSRISAYMLCMLFGVANHWIYPQLRCSTPWKLLSKPVLKAREFHKFEATKQAVVTHFERVHVWMIAIERNILYPLLVLVLLASRLRSSHPALNADGQALLATTLLHMLLISLCALRVCRTGYSQPQLLYFPLALSWLAETWLPNVASTQNQSTSMHPLTLLYLLTAVCPKLMEMLEKINFVFIYSVPWQISWGSAFHAFMQPFAIPHTGLMLAQTMISSFLSAPLNPFLGSSLFIMSYPRPVRFWERDYKTKRVDHSAKRLSAQLDRMPILDTSNLNSVFYEHLTRSLQQSLAGDLLLGRWATSIQQGDCFILASLNLNCLIHIVEVGNGFVTFQLRGLEFAGTYCHQREVEAISEDWTRMASGCCCFSGLRFSCLLPLSTAWSLRWLTWEVVTSKYVIEGYSITDNSAVNLLQVHELRRLLVTLYVKCMLYYAILSPNFTRWITDEGVLKALATRDSKQQGGRSVELDPVFCAANDEDFDLNLGGLSRQAFADFYKEWILFCIEQQKHQHGDELNLANFELVVQFSFALSILGRRTLAAASLNRRGHANAADSFLFGLYALFRGDMRVTVSADEWVLTDPEILSDVVAPAARMALKLHQDHFIAAEDFEEPACLFAKLVEYRDRIFISHEHDPAWREHILNNTPSLLALRHVFDDGQDDYKIVMLNRMALNMRVIKLNKECVRSFWAGQQHEQIFLRNRNPERGSIQNARSVLRNMINSSADQPIGYPIYVSPLTTSFVEMHSQIPKIPGFTPVTLESLWSQLGQLMSGLRKHFGVQGSSSLRSSQPENEPPAGEVQALAPSMQHSTT